MDSGTTGRVAGAPECRSSSGEVGTGRPTHALGGFATIAVLASLWLSLRPYRGIYHDAKLYAVQALNRLDPQTFRDDLYLAFGSQDSFTLFSRLYAPLVGWLGPPHAHALTVLIGAAAWIGALLWLTRSLFGYGREAILAATGVVALDPHYGAMRVFGYGEPFATPRLFAEALVICGLAAAQCGRGWLAAFTLAAAVAVHPVMALPGTALVFCVFLLRDARAWVGAAIVGLGAVLLAAWGVEPFARATVRFDDAWFAMVRTHARYALVSTWRWDEAASHALPLSALVVGVLTGKPEERRYLRAALVVASAGLVLSLVGGDWARNVLVTNLQPWRALWLAVLLGNAWAAVVAARTDVGWVVRGLMLFAVVASVLEHWLPLPAYCSAVAAGAATAVCVGERALCPRMRPDTTERTAALATVLVPVALVAGAWWFGLAAWLMLPIRVEQAGLDASVVTLAVLSASLLLLAREAPRRAPHWACGWVLGVVLLVASLCVVDQRTQWQRFVESGRVPDGLLSTLDDRKTIYWENGIDLLWFALGRPSYYSFNQATGVMFYRGNAEECWRRAEGLRGLKTADFGRPGDGLRYPKGSPHEGNPAGREQLAAACQSLPDLDMLVLTREVPGVPCTQWRAPEPMLLWEGHTPRFHRDFSLYQCSDFR